MYDRGGDGDWLFDFFIGEDLDFVVRLVGNRLLLYWNGERLAEDLAETCKMGYRPCAEAGRGGLPDALAHREGTIRYVKQAYELEDVRLLSFGRLKAMVSIALAVAYFAMAWLGLDGPDEPEGPCQMELAL